MEKEIIKMPKNIAQYNLLISCPGDISTELQVIKDAVEKFNTMFTILLGFLFEQNTGVKIHMHSLEENLKNF